jgi:hypothetical protein
MSERTIMAVVSDMRKHGTTVELQILVDELVMLTARLQAEADHRAYERERKRAYRDKAGQGGTVPIPPTPPRDKYINKTPLTPQTLGSFEGFYSAFPKKVGKGSAKKAYRNALKRASAEEILAGAKRYAAQRAGQDPQYTAGPAPWLNADRWLDEPDRKPGANVVGFRKEFKPEPVGPKITEEERQANLAKLAQVRFGAKKP